jgi:hypothetical protein
VTSIATEAVVRGATKGERSDIFVLRARPKVGALAKILNRMGR